MTQVTPSYVRRDFPGLVEELKSIIARVRPDLISDFSDASMGGLLVDLLAVVGDNANYAIDSASLECFLSTARRLESGRYHAESVGYAMRPANAATAVVAPTSLPAAVTQYGGVIPAGSSIRVSKSVQFEVTSDTYIPIGALSITVPVTEGATYTETLDTVSGASSVYTVSRTNVAADSWRVLIGSTEWRQVDDVTKEPGATLTYSVDFNSVGRLKIVFGDGVSGAIPTIPPTVIYRTCAGASGNVPAHAINGNLPVTYTPSGGSATTVNVAFENYIVSQSVYGDVLQRLGESVYASTPVNAYTLQAALPYYPVQQGQCTITIPGTVGGQAMVLACASNGVVTLTSNTTPFVFVSGTVTYSTGLISLVFSSTPGQYPSTTTPLSVSYFYYPPASARTLEVLGAATGGTDRESLTELKRNIKNYMRTANRMQSYSDYTGGLVTVPGVVLAHAEPFRDSAYGNVASLYTWGLTTATLTTTGSEGSTASVSYNRYSQINSSLSVAIQRYLRRRALLTVHHVIQKPGMVWLDAYLGTVVYDQTYTAAQVRSNLMAAAVKYFQTAGGFEFRQSKFTAAVLTAPGVKHVSLPRLTVGYGSRDDVVEYYPVTTASATYSGSLDRTDALTTDYNIIPGSVTVYVKQGSTTITLVDNANGAFTISSGTGLTLTASSINYRTRAWSVTFSASLSAYGEVSATFDDVAEDLRLQQQVPLNTAGLGDYWPPSNVSVSDPVVTPPLRDGHPLFKIDASGTRTVVTPTTPFTASPNPDTLVYGPLRDILLAPLFADAAYYDNTYFYNDNILYTSNGVSTDTVRAVNLRRLTFDLSTT